MDTFKDIIERAAKDAIRNRMETWMRYEFEKRMLPNLLEEATKAVRVECFTNGNIPEDVRVLLRFEKTELVPPTRKSES